MDPSAIDKASASCAHDRERKRMRMGNRIDVKNEFSPFVSPYSLFLSPFPPSLPISFPNVSIIPFSLFPFLSRFPFPDLAFQLQGGRGGENEINKQNPTE